MADGPNWDSIFRNGQLIWQEVPEHREILVRYHGFYKGTVDEQIFSNKYPGFVDAMEAEFPAPKVEEVKEEKKEEGTDDLKIRKEVKGEGDKEDAVKTTSKAAHVAKKGRPPKSSH